MSFGEAGARYVDCTERPTVPEEAVPVPLGIGWQLELSHDLAGSIDAHGTREITSRNLDSGKDACPCRRRADAREKDELDQERCTPMNACAVHLISSSNACF